MDNISSQLKSSKVKRENTFSEDSSVDLNSIDSDLKPLERAKPIKEVTFSQSLKHEDDGPTKIDSSQVMRRPKDEDKKNFEFTVRKQYTDIMGGLIYTLGCSLVHLALFVAIWMVILPDQEKARRID